MRDCLGNTTLGLPGGQTSAPENKRGEGYRPGGETLVAQFDADNYYSVIEDGKLLVYQRFIGRMDNGVATGPAADAAWRKESNARDEGERIGLRLMNLKNRIFAEANR
jgi:hypothetical protein